MRDEQVLFAFAKAVDEPDGVPALLFLIPQAAWDYMKDGRGHDFDLTNLGIPLKVLIARTATNESGMNELRAVGVVDSNTKDAREVDISFKERTKQ